MVVIHQLIANAGSRALVSKGLLGERVFGGQPLPQL